MFFEMVEVPGKIGFPLRPDINSKIISETTKDIAKSALNKVRYPDYLPRVHGQPNKRTLFLYGLESIPTKYRLWREEAVGRAET